MCFFFFNDAATTEIYTLSLHDALPISCRSWSRSAQHGQSVGAGTSMTRVISSGVGVGRRPGQKPGHQASRRPTPTPEEIDRKSTRLNSSHQIISYAVFCLKKKKYNPPN